MKRFLTIIFASFYLLLSVGANIDVHYCGKNIQSVKINAENIKSCCGENEIPGCCSNRSYLVQLDVEQEVYQNDLVFYVFSSPINENSSINELVPVKEKKIFYNKYVPPNPIKKFILFSSLTYYG